MIAENNANSVQMMTIKNDKRFSSSSYHSGNILDEYELDDWSKDVMAAVDEAMEKWNNSTHASTTKDATDREEIQHHDPSSTPERNNQSCKSITDAEKNDDEQLKSISVKSNKSLFERLRHWLRSNRRHSSINNGNFFDTKIFVTKITTNYNPEDIPEEFREPVLRTAKSMEDWVGKTKIIPSLRYSHPSMPNIKA